MSARLSPYSFAEGLQPARETPFVPDASFYNSVNCEGLWVCTSKSVEDEVLQRACKLVRTLYSEELRQKWGEFRAPKWAKDPGPMRLIILDNRSNE